MNKKLLQNKFTYDQYEIINVIGDIYTLKNLMTDEISNWDIKYINECFEFINNEKTGETNEKIS